MTNEMNRSSITLESQSHLTHSSYDSHYTENDSLSLSFVENKDVGLCAKVRTRRQNNTPGMNSFSLQMEKLRNFQNNHLKHMIVNSPSIKKINDKSFSQFFLLSASTEGIIYKDGLASNEPILSSSFYKPAQVVDRYPLTLPNSKPVLTSGEVASFCFPSSGVKFRFIPSCAKELAIGRDGDKYQLHTVRKLVCHCNSPIICFCRAVQR